MCYKSFILIENIQFFYKNVTIYILKAYVEHMGGINVLKIFYAAI